MADLWHLAISVQGPPGLGCFGTLLGAPSLERVKWGPRGREAETPSWEANHLSDLAPPHSWWHEGHQGLPEDTSHGLALSSLHPVPGPLWRMVVFLLQWKGSP